MILRAVRLGVCLSGIAVQGRNGETNNYNSLGDLFKEFQEFKLGNSDFYNPFADLQVQESPISPSLRISSSNTPTADESTNDFLAKYDNKKETESDEEISLVQKQYGALKEQHPELSESELFDLETQQGLELLDDSTLKSTPDMVDIEYGDEFQGTFARRFGAVRSMLTELSCRSGTCVHSRKYTKALMDYGCNCYPRGKENLLAYEGLELWHYASRGKPIDEVDKACKQAFVNYKCFDYDRENEEMSDNMTCRAGIPFKFHMKNGEIICGPAKSPNYEKNKEQNQCKLAACQIERAFSYKVFDIIGSDPIG